MTVIENKYYTDWRILVNELESLPKQKFLFRGQSNNYDFKSGRFFKWPIISSFNRYYPIGTYNFRTFLHQQLQDDLFKSVYQNYNTNSIKYLLECSQLERIYFLQHYGIPTCFLDFTRDPFVALYFAISSVKASSGGAYDIEGNPRFYPDESFITIYCIDYLKIIERYSLRELLDTDLPYNYDDYSVGSYHVGFDICPSNHIKDISNNFNLDSQSSAFVLFDNNGGDLDFVTFLEYEKNKQNMISDDVVVTAYNLNYNSLFKKLHSKSPNNQSIFNYLQRIKKTGMHLFNDMQGLKYDLNYFHHF